MFYALGVLHRWCCPNRKPACTELNERQQQQQQPPSVTIHIPLPTPAPPPPPNTPNNPVFQDSASEDSDTTYNA